MKKNMSKNLFVSTILQNPVMRASEIIRYSGVECRKQEDIMQHTSQVSIMSYFIGLSLMQYEDIDIGALLEKSLLHDLDETITGDIPRPTKYYSDDITNGIKDMADESAKLLVNRYSHVESEELRNRALKAMNECKKGKEGAIIAVTDMLSVAFKSYEELVLLSNKKFVKVAKDLTIYLKELLCELEYSSDYVGKYSRQFESGKSILYLYELVNDTLTLIEDIVKEDEHILNTMDYVGHTLVKG